MRDLETIETALTAAETGHLVMSTLHTLDATETINRIISAFPPYQQKQVRLQLGSGAARGSSRSGSSRRRRQGRVPAIEVLLCTTRVREMIEDRTAPRRSRTPSRRGTRPTGCRPSTSRSWGSSRAAS